MSFRDRQLLDVVCLTFDPHAIAKAFYVSENSVMEVMGSNGRAVSFWAKHWVSQVYNVPIDELNHEHETTALSGRFGEMGFVRAAIRTLSARSNIRFQRNARIGVGRTCTQQDLIEDLHKFDRQIVVSISKFPKVYLYPLSATMLLTEAMAGQLTPTGINPREFVGWVSERHRIEHRNYDLSTEGTQT